MSRYFTLWVSLLVLSPFLLDANAIECSEKETLLNPITRTVTQLSDCLMECTGMMYIRKLQLQDNHNIRLTDSIEGDLGEYCWSTELKCTVGESFQRAYVVLPVDTSAVRHENLEVKTTSPTATPLHAHSNPTTVAESCGLRYDVTQHFSGATEGTSFCVQVGTLQDVLGDKVLKCPPFLVTFWQRSPNQFIQGGVR
ncbi:hypothetical protein EPR50_G00170150 [Xyrichtys novacula]|uniref:Uncharacterized protein n=1 Tax=Xyrichtys novacula TaxID=13765 RepID=A0AAV1GC62_XYRNO|nr:hypothetical protein EPR50_G00170150 [Xyrichtys novacula]